MAVRITCNRCGSIATIQSSAAESDAVKKLYCSCNNPDCGHTFVMTLEFSHTLSPSALDMPASVLDRIRHASRMEQKKIFDRMLPG
jgi:hypothetical protein